MNINKIIISNFKGISSPIYISPAQFACIVGKNDMGKSTILKAIDAFLNDSSLSTDDCNIYTDSGTISIEMIFNCDDANINIDDAVTTTLKTEELYNENQCLHVKKTWDTSQKTIKAKYYIKRKRYSENDFLMLDEKNLISLCKKLGIETSKANGEEFNNKEKRDKLRLYCVENNINYSYEYDELPTSGQTRAKKILDAIKNILPKFEYFRADRSLADSDSSVQKYFKDKAFKLLKDEINTDDVETAIKDKISEALSAITNKINQVVSTEEQVTAQVDFDWSKLITTTFKCKKDAENIPLSSRGDGFRRITMMSYFEMLAEENCGDKNLIYGFEEPETFLHPETQKRLYNNIVSMTDNGYQVFVTTHSPNIVAETTTENLIFINKIDNKYIVKQNNDIDIEAIVNDLGIKSNDLIFTIYDKVKCFLLLEGIDDVMAFTHTAQKYKEAGKISQTFEEMGILLIPIGGCGAIQHWTNLKIIKKLNKPYHILLDSDKTSIEHESPNLKKLKDLGYKDEECSVTKKREIECYIPSSYFKSFDEPIDIEYGDWDDVKEICKTHASAGRLGGRKVCERHFLHLNYTQLRETFCPDGNDLNDEFLSIYNMLVSKSTN
ncbi:MAG: AAA family ATPase [Alistipes sp.]|nr:AAA family ATPase [Alistipes sp.]